MSSATCSCGVQKPPLPTEPHAPVPALYPLRCDACFARIEQRRADRRLAAEVRAIWEAAISNQRSAFSRRLADR